MLRFFPFWPVGPINYRQQRVLTWSTETELLSLMSKSSGFLEFINKGLEFFFQSTGPQSTGDSFGVQVNFCLWWPPHWHLHCLRQDKAIFYAAWRSGLISTPTWWASMSKKGSALPGGLGGVWLWRTFSSSAVLHPWFPPSLLGCAALGPGCMSIPSAVVVSKMLIWCPLSVSEASSCKTKTF